MISTWRAVLSSKRRRMIRLGGGHMVAIIGDPPCTQLVYRRHLRIQKFALADHCRTSKHTTFDISTSTLRTPTSLITTTLRMNLDYQSATRPSTCTPTWNTVKLFTSYFKYGVEGWTLNKSDRNRIESFEMWCWRKMLGISWKEHRSNISILEEIGLERE